MLDPVLKIFAVGDPLDGLKAKLLSKFTGETEADAFDFYSASPSIGKHTVKFNLWDIIGQEEETLTKTRQASYRNAKVILLVFQYCSAKSFKSIQEKWYPEIKRCAPNIPIVLLGVTSDTPSQVTVAEARAFADDQSLDVFIECRLDDPKSIKRVFDYAAIAGLAAEKKPDRKLLAAECYNTIRTTPPFIASAIEIAMATHEVNKKSESLCYLNTLPPDVLKIIMTWIAIAEGHQGPTTNTINLICENIRTKTWADEYKGLTLFRKLYPPYRKAAQFEELKNKCTI